MEKVIAVTWAKEGESRTAHHQRLREQLVPALKAAGAKHIRLNLPDAAVEPAHELNQAWQVPQQDAVIQFWVRSSHMMFFAGIDAALAQVSSHHAAWLVLESTVIANEDHAPTPSADGSTRTFGWSQMAFLSFRKDKSREDVLRHWHDHHTEVAIVTQSNFEYVQHLIARPLTKDAPAYDAIVEECFPPEAMTSPAAFFAAGDDEALLAENLRRMMDSCEGFLQFGQLDVIPTSQYQIND
jgi:hypothetical protein